MALFLPECPRNRCSIRMRRSPCCRTRWPSILNAVPPREGIARTIFILRGHRVILDSNLAAVYGVETRTLNQAVKRNAGRFPEDFRFQLTDSELLSSRSQSVILKSARGRNVKFLPHAFTEHGAIMAATVLSSPRAVDMSIYVVRAFVRLRTMFASNTELAQRLDRLEARIEKKLASHDESIAAMFSAIRELMNPSPTKRRGIGFTANIETAKPKDAPGK
jgi:hypothetical protein